VGDLVVLHGHPAGFKVAVQAVVLEVANGAMVLQQASAGGASGGPITDRAGEVISVVSGGIVPSDQWLVGQPLVFAPVPDLLEPFLRLGGAKLTWAPRVGVLGRLVVSFLGAAVGAGAVAAGVGVPVLVGVSTAAAGVAVVRRSAAAVLARATVAGAPRAPPSRLLPAATRVTDWFGSPAGRVLSRFARLFGTGVVGAIALVRRGWRVALFHTVPLGVVYATWYFTYGRDRYTSPSARGHLGLLVKWIYYGVLGLFDAVGHYRFLGIIFAILIFF